MSCVCGLRDAYEYVREHTRCAAGATDLFVEFIIHIIDFLDKERTGEIELHTRPESHGMSFVLHISFRLYSS